jgi:putative ABC transport system ATP-binding protein
MSILQATSVEKHFQEGRETITVLKGIDFHAERGEIVSLEGPSGSGKTTFLSILGCILTPSSGAVVIDGQPVTANKLANIRKRSLGFVFQQFNLFPSLTAVENVEYALNVKGVKGNDARREA